MKDDPRKPTAPAVTRAAAVLDLLGASAIDLTLTDIARALDLAKSSTSTLCNALEEAGLVQRREGAYTLGRKTVELGGAYLRRFDVVREFYRACARSEILAHELLQLAILDHDQVLYLARHEGHAPLRLSASIGDRFPASITAVGNVLLAQLPDAEVARRFSSPDSLPQWTEHSVASLEALLGKLNDVRKRGYAVDLGETNSAVVGVAVLVRPRSSADRLLALGASLFAVEGAHERIDLIAGELHRVAAGLNNPMLPERLGA